MNNSPANRYQYLIIDISEKDEIGFKAVIPKFPKLHVFADSPNELHEAVLAAIKEEIEAYKARNLPVPKPDKKSYSGRFILRINPNMHERLAELSVAEGKTLNQYIKGILEEKV